LGGSETARLEEHPVKSFLLAALQTILRSLIGTLNYERIKLLVVDAEQEPLSGTEKRALVLQSAKTLGLEVGTALLNLAIETAVNALRNGK